MNYMAYGIGPGKESWVPVTWGGLNYIATKEQLTQMCQMMKQWFPQNQYRIEEVTDV